LKDYYNILGLNKEATASEIKSAYKSLALKYHPDRNKGRAFAEEQFKNINEAYQTLSDKYKKDKYDLVFTYRKRPSTYQPYQTYAPSKKTPANDWGRWKNAPNFSRRDRYRVDKNYYKEQLYTIGAILLVIILVSSGSAISNHYTEKRAIEEASVITNKLEAAQSHFIDQHYDSTFQLVLGLIKQYPIEVKYRSLRQQYVDIIHQRGIDYFLGENYPMAIQELNVAKAYIRKQDLSIWSMIGDAHFALHSYQKAIDAYDYVVIRESTNIKLVMKIGDLYLILGDKVNALSYFTSAKSIFKERQSDIYGPAFELVMKPELLDSTYFDIFKKRGNLNYELSHFEEATTDFNWAIYLKPKYSEGYLLRAECWYNLGRTYRACLDWQEAFQLGEASARKKIRAYCDR
jgi:curved DNA-binding protein CbpA